MVLFVVFSSQNNKVQPLKQAEATAGFFDSGQNVLMAISLASTILISANQFCERCQHD